MTVWKTYEADGRTVDVGFDGRLWRIRHAAQDEQADPALRTALRRAFGIDDRTPPWLEAAIRDILGVRMPAGLRFACPCCDHLTLDRPPPGTHETCEVCGWEDDWVQLLDLDDAGGANKVSLRVARENVRRVGSAHVPPRSPVRRPRPFELPRPWATRSPDDEYPLDPRVVGLVAHGTIDASTRDALDVAVRLVAELADGREVPLLDGRGFSLTAHGGAPLSHGPELLADVALCVGPDEPRSAETADAEEAAYWSSLAQVLRGQGIETSGPALAELPLRATIGGAERRFPDAGAFFRG